MPTETENRVRLSHISSEAFVSDTDRAALSNLQSLPVLPTIIRKYNELSADKIWYVQNSATSVRCGPDQLPKLYELFHEACAILDVPEPELYVRHSAEYNAFTAGMNRPFVVLHSAITNDFSDEELMFVIGHELGHIKCGHVLYQSIGRLLVPLLEAIGQVTLGLGQLAGMGVVAAFFEWMRQAEFSCDRAGTLVCQNPHAAMSGVMKLGGGHSRFGEMSVETFLEQARRHHESSGLEGLAKALQFVLYNWQLSHPHVVYRAKGLDEWVQSGAYERILGGEYIRDVTGRTQMGAQVKCASCGQLVSPGVRFCPNCGKEMTNRPTADGKPPVVLAHCGKCGAANPPGTKFCVDCGAPMG